MKTLSELGVKISAGPAAQDIDRTPMTPYSDVAHAFLADLSRRLMKSPTARAEPDVIAFAFWCRDANLKRLAREFDPKHLRLGRGLAFHIAPSNAPVNFAFSFAFGLLAGNANIVRVPETVLDIAENILAEIRGLFDDPAYARIAAMNRFVTYPRDDATTAAISKISNARIIWGGDETIARLKTMSTPPRCVDIVFADRFSMCVMDAEAVLATSDDETASLAKQIYNDIFLMDQNACSSPHLVLWQGEPAARRNAQDKLWPMVAEIAEAEYALHAVHAVDKLMNVCRAAVSVPEAETATRHGNYLYRVELEALPAEPDACRGRFGFVYEGELGDLGTLATFVNDRYQTLTFFGVEKDELVRAVVDHGLTGIDRVVPVGQATDMDVIWDGYDIVGDLSRIISA